MRPARYLILSAALLALFAANAAADDVLLLLPKNFDVVAQRGWSRNKYDGYKEFDRSQASKAILCFRGKNVTAGESRTDRHPSSGHGTVIIKYNSKLVATYDKGHLSGTWESSMRNWIEGWVERCNDAEYMQVYYKGTITGEANADGILKITVQMTENTILDREYVNQSVGSGKDARTMMIYGGGWKKRDQEPNLYSWGAEFKLPVGELQSSQKFTKEEQDAGDQQGVDQAGAMAGTDQGQNGDQSQETEPGKSDTAPVTPADTDPVTPGEATPVSPGAAAAGAGVVGALSALGAYLMMRANNMGLKDVIDGVNNLFETANAPEPEPPEPAYNDGDVNENGEVWSENSGWVNRDIYEKDVATRQLINSANLGANSAPDATAQELGRTWLDSADKLADMQRTGRYVDLSTKLAENFGSTAEKAWCLDFINRHAKAGPDGYELDPETARQMYDGLKQQMYTSGQISNAADAEYQAAVASEIGDKTAVVEQIRDNSMRVNRVLARFDPTGTGQKIVGIQQGLYGAANGYDKGGLAAAAEAGMLAVADNYSQGYASTNYNAVKDAYAENGISDESLAEKLARANLEAANNKYNVLDHAGKAISSAIDGEYGQAADSMLDALDAKDAARDDYGKAREYVTRPEDAAPDRPPTPPADVIPDTTPDMGKKSLGTLRRESFEETRVSFDNETKMMEKLNEIADMPDPVQRQAEIIKIRNSDPATFNIVQRQLHPDTARQITEANQQLGDKVVERQAQILESLGFTPEVRLTGKAGGADVDANWTLRDNQTGRILSDSETRKAADDALKQASDEVLKPLGTDADKLGHKVMNDSPEKFAVDPKDLGIKSRDGRLVDGKIVFEDRDPTKDPREAALTPPKDRISDAAMTTDASKSLGDVFNTKIDHIKDIAEQKGTVTESDMRDLAREIVKTNSRTFLPMSEKAGIKPTPEHRDLMLKLMLVRDGDISSKQLPPLSEINRILSASTSQLTDAIDR